MLKTLDRYILRKFMTTFFFTVLIFTMIAIVIDFSEKIEKFIEEPITQREIIFEYYPNFILFIASLLWPLFTLIAVIFFTSRMATNSEIISIFNAGVSYRRFMRPYIVGALIIALMNLFGNHYLVPMGNKKMLRIVYTYFDKDNDKGKTQNVHLFVAPNKKVFIEFYRKRDTTARNFRIEQFKDNQLASLLKAESARWDGKTKQWRLSNYEIHTFDGLNEGLIIGRGQELDTSLNLSPDDFVDYKEQHSMMTTTELSKYITNQKKRGVGNTKKYEVELYRRTADAFTIFILTVIGMSIASRKVRGGIGMHLAIGIVLGAAFIFLSRFSIVFATGQVMPPLIGIWMPNLVFAGIAAYLVANAQ
ncbi:MAG: LptF/LptG family permease, partial [Saprospiraceae bacterium]|nr:LptF/LptG family permease [Saprospiraceae bacterium]